MKHEKAKLPDTLVDYLDDLTKAQKDIIVSAVKQYHKTDFHPGLLPFMSRAIALAAVTFSAPIPPLLEL